MKRPLAALALPIALLLADAGNGNVTPPDMSEGVAKPAEGAPLPGLEALRDMDLRRWPAGRFYQSFTAQVDRLSNAHGSERPAVVLDVAELYLAQMMVQEARSTLADATPETPAQERRWQALSDAVTLLSGEALLEPDTSPLTAAARPDRALWLALQAVATGDPVLLYENIGNGLAGLSYQTRSLAHTVLPLLIEASVEIGEHRLAQQALGVLEAFPDLAGAPIGYYLRGRAQAVQNNEKSAVEAYFEAAKGWDRYAARGRLELGALALEDGSEGALLAAQDVLELGIDAWRGDRLEFLTIQRLAEIYSAQGRAIDALVSYGKLILRFPHEEGVDDIRTNAIGDLAKVYAAGQAGEISLARWLSVHVQLVPAYRYLPEFATHSETLADHVLALGATELAEVEYRRTLHLLRDMEDIIDLEVPPARRFDLYLKIAEAQARGGRLKAAKMTLAEMALPDGAEPRARWNKQRAEVLAGLGETEELLRTPVVNPNAHNLRHLGGALLRVENWADAVEFYSRLWAEYPGHFNVDDATYLLIAARRAGDEATAQQVVEAFPGLTESEDWRVMAESLLDAPATLLPLRRSAADSRLDSLEQALGRMTQTGQARP